MTEVLGWAATWGLLHRATTRVATPVVRRYPGARVSAERFAARSLSSLHAIVSSVCGAAIIRELCCSPSLGMEEEDQEEDVSAEAIPWLTSFVPTIRTPHSKILHKCISFEGGFYLYDALADIRRTLRVHGRVRLVDVGYLAHHIVPLLALPAFYRWRRRRRLSGDSDLGLLDFITASLLATNITTLFANVQWQWRALDPKATQRRSYKMLLSLNTLLYFFTRVGFWPWLICVFRRGRKLRTSLWTVFSSLPRHCRWGTSVLFAVNFIWWWGNVRKTLASTCPGLIVRLPANIL